MKTRKRLLSIILICCMTISLLPIIRSTAYAASSTTVPSGYTGIYTASDLNKVRNNLKGNYILMSDIDLSSLGEWKPIGGDFMGEGFSGVFDGNNHTIKNMTITDNSVEKSGYGYQYAALFSVIKGGTVKNIRSISGTINCVSSPCLHAAGIVADAYGATISRCANYVRINYKHGEPTEQSYGSASGISFSGGGIVGEVFDGDYGVTKISECVNYGVITGVGKSSPMDIGGIVGNVFASEAHIENCCNIASLSANTGYVSSDIGGIVGQSYKVKITDCYNLGAPLTCKVGKLKSGVSNANIGGIAGNVAGNADYTNIKNCVYLSGVNAVGYGTQGNSKAVVKAKANNDSAMQKQSTYSGFDFSSVWVMGGSNFPYPELSWRSGETTASQETSAPTKQETPSTGKNLCKTHKYSSKSGDVCTVCGYTFQPEMVPMNKTLYAKVDNVALRDNYYAQDSKVMVKRSKGSAIEVTHSLKNAVGRLWYKTKDGYYVYSENVTTTAPKKYTVTFVANGDKVNNLPVGFESLGNVRYGISFREENLPTRRGYTFVGYSTNKNATVAEYTEKNRSLLINKDITLYAIWVENQMTSAEEFVEYALSFSGKTKKECIQAGLNMGSGGWCNYFVYCCAQNLGLSDIIPKGGVSGLYSGIIAKGGYVAKTPEIGDIVIIDWKTASHPGVFNHVGIVCDVVGDEVHIVHGNYHGSKGESCVCSPEGCKYRNAASNPCKNGYKFKINDEQIYAYVRPNWK